MKSANKLKLNTGFFKMMFLFIAVVLFFCCPNNTIVYASEISVVDSQNTDTATTDTTDTLVTTDSSAATDDQGVVLGEGYYIDEQGQVFYDESIIKMEEQVIEEVIEEDTEEIIEDTVKEETKDTATDKKAQTKTAETVVKKPTYSEAELRLLTCLVYAEAGNQSYNGMLGVANVVINRADSDVYWHVNTIKEVIYDHKWAVQFSVTIKNRKTGLSAFDKALKAYDSGKFTGSNPTAEKKAMAKAMKAAKAALEGKNNIGKYLCFTNKREASSIKRHYNDYKIIGDHIFYRTK